MSKAFKIVLILLVGASLVSAVLAVFAFMGKEREYMKRILLEDKLASVLKDKRRLEEEVGLGKKAKEESEAKIRDMEKKIEKFLSQVEEEKNKGKATALDLDAKKRDILKLQEDLVEEKKEKSNISKKLDDLRVDYKKVQEDIRKIRDEKERLEKKLSNLKERSVDLDKIVLSPEGMQPPAELLRGRVLVVNRDYSFIVTDLGQNQGIKEGIALEIRNGTEFLGRAKVDKIYDTMSSASLLPGADINNIKKGNLVIESR
jgi:myosin heavy subunit